ncbi:hypothetical protein MRB53_002643 [Persea americana]|uniref:Uncharacterized protein n=1 Tax=Persea americana TaxID=3435 RepID=A0ACC2MVC2_PERAE|nr:hypothetical protein MRB53_002643 [Persea americana]
MRSQPKLRSLRWRRRRRKKKLAQVADETPQLNDAADIAAREDDAYDTRPFPGGPIEFTLLPSFKNHIATTILRGEEDGWVEKSYTVVTSLLLGPLFEVRA